MSNGPTTLSVTALLLLAACAAPTEYLVNTTADFPDANAGDNLCAGRGNLCSLRAAIEETNARPAGDAVRIVVPAGTYDLDEELVLTHDDVTISGADRDTTIIRQTGESFNGYRVLAINTSGNIWIGRVTLRDGGAETFGGALFVYGNSSYSLTLSECRIRDNRSDLGSVAADGAKGALNILNCVIHDNTSWWSSGCGGGGGGIWIKDARLVLFRTEIRDNCGGAGVAINGGVDHLILQSTIAGNASGTLAGGLYMVVGAQGRIEDSTIAKNSGPEAGGVLISDGKLVLRSATIVGNASEVPDKPGGVLSKDGANVSLKNTVIASNTGPPADCSGALLSLGGNFIGTLDNSCTFVGAATDVVNGGSPGLGSLSQSGPTRSMLPYSDSPLVNAGVSGCGPTDQRSQHAPVAACDIGAVERQSPSFSPLPH